MIFFFLMSLGVLAGDLTASPLLSERPRVVILGYHEVEPGGVPAHATIPRGIAVSNAPAELNRYTVSTDDFRAQLDSLDRHGYTVIPLRHLKEFLTGARPFLPARSVVITADDGWISVKTQMQPELSRRGMPFTAFVYPSVVEQHSQHPFNLTWEDVASLSAQGVDIESHSLSHPFLSRARHPEMEEAAYSEWLAIELRKSRELLEEHICSDVKFLAYPFGDFDETVVSAAKGAGYTAAVTVRRGVVNTGADPMMLGRFLLHNDTALGEFESWLETAK